MASLITADDAEQPSVQHFVHPTVVEDETEAALEEDFPVLQSSSHRIHHSTSTDDADNSDTKTDDEWNVRTSFTADSPYFDAFCQSEMQSLGVLSTTLCDISRKAKIFAQCGAMMSQATQQLALACKLRHGMDDEDDPSLSGHEIDEQLYERRKDAIGDEMTKILELLGEVCFEDLLTDDSDTFLLVHVGV